MKKKLTLQDFADYIVQQEGIAPKDADAFVRAFFDVIEEGLHEDKFVKIKGFGTFKLVSVSERESVNVNTGERIQISGHTKVSFTPDNTMKELVNRPFAHFETVDLNDDTDTKEFEEIDEEMEAEENEEAEETEDANTEEDVVSEEETEVTTTDGDVASQEGKEDESTSEGNELNVTSAHNVAGGSATQTNTPNSASPNSINDTTPTTIITNEEEDEEELISENNEEETSEAEQSQPSDEIEANTESPTESTNADNAEEIVVTDPTPISSHTPHTDDTGTTSNTLGYTYAEVPSRKKHNWWRTLALTLCVIMLMAGSYFAGYYRILCPECNDIFVTQPIEVADTTTAQPAPVPTQPADTVKADSTEHKAEVPTPQPKTEEQTTTNATTDPTNGAKAEDKDETKAAENTEKRPAIYRVKPGDNLSRIAKKYYGDDKFAERIIRHNNLKDANTIHVGMELRLP